MMKFKHGFTLAETLIVLVTIGVIAMLMIPTMKLLRPDPIRMNIKKAYFALESVTNALANDNTYFSPQKFGEISFTDTTDPNETGYEGATKFCELLALKFNIQTTVNCADASAEGYTDTAENVFDYPLTFTTIDGIQWYLKVMDWGASGASSTREIGLDMNGAEKPNCFYEPAVDSNGDGEAEEEEKCPDPDRFIFIIKSNGMVTTSDTKALAYLKTSALRKEEELKDEEEEEES